MAEHRYCSALRKMKITEDSVVKVVKERVSSAAFHPCSSSLLMAAGDKLGKVGLWNFVSCICCLITRGQTCLNCCLKFDTHVKLYLKPPFVLVRAQTGAMMVSCSLSPTLVLLPAWHSPQFSPPSCSLSATTDLCAAWM